MLRHFGHIAFCACVVTGIGCDGGKLTAPTPPTTVRVEFGGRVVNTDTGGPVANVRVSVASVSHPGPQSWVFPNETATSGADGAFTVALNLPGSWEGVSLKLTARRDMRIGNRSTRRGLPRIVRRLGCIRRS
jgi:hypothetical protein